MDFGFNGLHSLPDKQTGPLKKSASWNMCPPYGYVVMQHSCQIMHALQYMSTITTLHMNAIV